MKNANFSRKWCSIKFKLFEVFKENKKTTLFFVLIVAIGLFTGIFAAIRYHNGFTLLDFNDFSLTNYLNGELGTSRLFYTRLFSVSVISIIVLISSFSVFLMPVNFIVLIYRSYLLTLNCTIIILFNGLGGIICSLLIILPCQLLSLLLILMFCSYSFKYSCIKKRYGVCNEFKIWHKFLIFLFLLLLVNLLETFLLYIFSSKIILVI
jgi:hypothetical protein